MGNLCWCGPGFTPDELHYYEDCLYLSAYEVDQLWREFRKLSPQKLKKKRMAYIDKDELLKHKSLKYNPVFDRMLYAFGVKTTKGTYVMNFNHWVLMWSCFSFYCSEETKCEYYFKMMDFDKDGKLNPLDLKKYLLPFLQSNHEEDVEDRDSLDSIEPDELDGVTRYLVLEADVTDDKLVSYTELEILMQSSDHFERKFRMLVNK